MMKQVERFFTKHTSYNAAVHGVAGIGIGMLLTYPLAGIHPVRWGVAFLVLGLLGHLYPLLTKK